jgi:hypothetical protein
MASYTVSGDDGTTRIRNAEGLGNIFHHFEFKGHTTPTTGTVTIKKRAPGAPEDKLLDVGVYDFSSPSELNFAGVVSEWVVTVDSVDTDLLYMTVTSLQVGKREGGGISPADQDKLDAISNTGSGQVITTEERTKLATMAHVTDEDELLEGLAFGNIYAKTAQVG